jgi:hypothetical protein
MSRHGLWHGQDPPHTEKHVIFQCELADSVAARSAWRGRASARSVPFPVGPAVTSVLEDRVAAVRGAYRSGSRHAAKIGRTSGAADAHRAGAGTSATQQDIC